jgi:glutamine phosphoribosylpyrophosphate amidotransferase
LRYLGVPELLESISSDHNQSCLGCVTARYPTLAGQRHYDRAARGEVSER